MGASESRGLPRHHVPRPRLAGRLLDSGVGVVEAGAGYGKSVLAAEYRAASGMASVMVPLTALDDDPAVLVSSLSRALRAAGLSDLAQATADAGPRDREDRLLDVLAGAAEPVLIALDDVHHIRRAGAADLVLRLARTLPGRHRLLLLARRLPPRLEPVRRLGGVTCLDSAALALNAAETAQLWARWLGRPAAGHEVAHLLEATGGWAAAVVLAVSMTARRTERHAAQARLPAGPDVIPALVGAVLEAMTAGDRASLVQLAHLPWLSPEVAGEVTGEAGLFGRLVDAGVPLIRVETGWWELPSPVAACLAARAPLGEAVASAAARAYTRAGDPVSAVRVPLAAGLPELAADALAGLSPEEAEDLGWAEIRGLTELLPDAAIAAQPRVLVHLARTAETAHQAQSRRVALDRARALAGAGSRRVGDGTLRELDAEWARHLMWDERTRGEAAELARSVLAQASPGEMAARARALDVLGRLGCAMFSGMPTTAEAERWLTEAARLARRIGQRTWAAQALVPLAMAVYHENCRFDLALATLDQAIADLPARGRYRALAVSFRCAVLTELGRYPEAEAAIEEVREIGQAVGEEWALAMASWSEALLASVTGDRDRTISAVLDTETHRGTWFGQSEGVEWLANAADALDRVGEHEMARSRMAAARSRMAGYERPVTLFEAAILGRSGDSGHAAEAIAACLDRPDITPLDRWPLLLLRAHAALRRGDPAAGRQAAEAFETCRALGHPEGPLLRERAVATELLPVAAVAGSATAAALLDRAGSLSVRLLGSFEVRRGGAVVELPPGRPALAVRAVAVAGGRIPAEALLEILWPETEPAAGRNRLRNLLSRVRAAAGDVLARDGSMIRLEPGCQVDAVAFEAAAQQALAARSAGAGDEAVRIARAALARYRGELLPGDRYEAWSISPRERLRGLQLELLDLLAAEAGRRGETDEAIRHLRKAIDAEPGDEQRYVLLARLLAGQGRAASARSVLRQARAVLDDLGLPASTALAVMESALDGSGAPSPARPVPGARQPVPGARQPVPGARQPVPGADV